MKLLYGKCFGCLFIALVVLGLVGCSAGDSADSYVGIGSDSDVTYVTSEDMPVPSPAPEYLPGLYDGNQDAGPPLLDHEDYIRAVLEDFLAQFLSIFQIGWRDMQSGAFFDSEEWMLSPASKIPLVSLGGEMNEWGEIVFDGVSFFDMQGNAVTDAPFMFAPFDPQHVAVATHFSLYDLFDDGTPVVLVFPVYWASSGFGWSAGGPTIFVYMDGSYREAFVAETHPNFFRDDAGRLYLFYNDNYHGIYGNYRFDFVDGRFVTEPVSPDLDVFDEAMRIQGMSELASQLEYSVGQRLLADRLPAPEVNIPLLRVFNDMNRRIAAGASHSLAIDAQRGLWAWGSNERGQIGDGGDSEYIRRPVRVLSDVVSVSAGGVHSMALTSEGGLWAWGANGRGQLGDGTTTDRRLPVLIKSDVVAVQAGNAYTIAVTSDNRLWAWGANGHGQLGDGTVGQDRLSPVEIMAPQYRIISISAGLAHTALITECGRLHMWGSNEHGQAVQGSGVPYQVHHGARMVSLGHYHSLAVLSRGTLATVGLNAQGQLGLGDDINRGQLEVVFDNVNMSAAGANHSLAQTINGGLWAWGGNQYGQLGDGSTDDSQHPFIVAYNIIEVAAGDHHSLAMRGDGVLLAWGRNNNGQLGEGAGPNRHSPVEIMALW